MEASGEDAQARKLFPGLDEVTPLTRWELKREPLGTKELRRVAKQALELISGLYVHLPLKRAMHAADPERRLRLLLSRLVSPIPPTEPEFHAEMLDIFAALRDLHTRYILPRPYRNRIAFLPFAVEECYVDGRRAFVVTKTHEAVKHRTFRPGVEVKHWNGTPIELAVELNGRRCSGSNADARRARGIDWLTFRWLGAIARPDEDWVRISYVGDGGPDVVEWPWWTAKRPEEDERPDPSTRSELVLGIDQDGEWIRRVKLQLFGGASPAEPPPLPTEMPDVFRAQRIPGPDAEVGYLRIFTFSADPGKLVDEAKRLLSELPPAGLIVDVRGNGGGCIDCAQNVLRLLGGESISPAPFSFLNTPLTALLVESKEFKEDQPDTWNDLKVSIEQGLETGAQFSRGFPLGPGGTGKLRVGAELPYGRPEGADNGGNLERAYDGLVVLVVDALSYSATDVFAAGFQDHGLGRVMGTNGRTGAGGATVLHSELVQQMLPESYSWLKPTDHGASFTVAARRCTRVGQRAGTPLEDLGVQPEVIHDPTREDLMDGNVDLRKEAVNQLKELEKEANQQ